MLYIEAFPTSPLILNPFTDQLLIPKALRPTPKSDLRDLGAARRARVGQQNSMGNETHQIWPSQIGYPDPIVYKIDLQVATHSFTTSQVLPIDAQGQADGVVRRRPASTYPPGTERTLPPSTIYGFNGTFPGPMINAEYGKPALVRFENHLDENPLQPGPAGLRRAGLVVPDPPAQRPHRAGERRQPALLDAVRARSTRATGRGSGSTTCT